MPRPRLSYPLALVIPMFLIGCPPPRTEEPVATADAGSPDRASASSAAGDAAEGASQPVDAAAPDIAPSSTDGPTAIDSGADAASPGDASGVPTNDWKSLARCTQHRPAGATCGGAETPNAVTGVSFSPDGQWLASAGRDRVEVWRFTEAGLVADRPFLVSGGTVRPRFSPDGKLLATLSSDSGDSYLLDVATRMRVPGLPFQVHGKSGPFGGGFDFIADGSYLVISGGDEFAAAENVKTGRSDYLDNTLPRNRRTFAVASRQPSGAGLVGSGPSFWVAYDDPTPGMTAVVMQNLANPAFASGVAPRFRTSMPVRALAFSPDGNTLAVGLADLSVFRLDVRDPAVIKRVPGTLSSGTPANNISSMAYSGDGRYLALGYDSGPGVPAAQRGYMAVVTANFDIQSFQYLELPVASVAFSVDARALALGMGDCWGVLVCQD
jgi:WD40 repeat protein